jgi:hypothetical protein
VAVITEIIPGHSLLSHPHSKLHPAFHIEHINYASSLTCCITNVCPVSLIDVPLYSHLYFLLPCAQELVTANSSLKATLQQRDNALEQRCHELACCESMLQEVHERLAASEAAAAEAAAQHCEAMWAKGQVAGLMEVNESLQVQLEQQAQELEELKAALERYVRVHLRDRCWQCIVRREWALVVCVFAIVNVA